MKYIIVVAAIILIGCGSVSVEPVGEQQQAAITSHIANFSGGSGGSTVPPLPNIQSHLCHPYFIGGSGANSQSLILPGSVPQCGGIVSLGSTVGTAYPNSCVNPGSARQGTMSLFVRCQPLSDFGPVTFGFTDFLHTWNGTGSLEAVSSGKQMSQLAPTFTSYNACFLTTLNSMSVGNEYAWLTYSGTHAWLNAQGFKGLAVGGRCQRLGRAGGPVQTIEAWPGAPGTGISVASGACLITQVNGSIDNGSVSLTQNGGVWGIQITGDVGYARAECYTYN